jgi:Zn finger protein HypA/HybF involved in hydrogenase expression
LAREGVIDNPDFEQEYIFCKQCGKIITVEQSDYYDGLCEECDERNTVDYDRRIYNL